MQKSKAANDDVALRDQQIVDLKNQLVDLESKKASVDRMLVESLAVPRDYLRSLYTHQMFLQMYSERLESSQLWANWLLLILESVMVISGILFTWFQLRHLVNYSGRQANPDTRSDVSIHGMQITTSVVGVAVLALALGFLYLIGRGIVGPPVPNPEPPAGKVSASQ